MKSIIHQLPRPAIISAVMVLPFLVMELVNRRNFNESFPFPLFLFLWLLPFVFILLLMPLLRKLQGKDLTGINPIILLIRLVSLTFIAWVWFSLIIDQFSCFMGVGNCD